MKKISSKVQLAVAALLIILFAWNQLQAAQSIDVKQAQTILQQGALLLDVRENDEYATIHAPNALLIPLGQLSSRLNEIEAYKDKPIAVICHSGRRSAKAALLLQEAGYKQVSSVSGGMIAWENAGLAVVRKP